MNLSPNMEDLMCPISLDLLEDPINLPCCGRTISRSPMIQSKNGSNYCPLCRGDLSAFDPISAPVAVNIAYILENIKNKNNPSSNNIPKSNICDSNVVNVTILDSSNAGLIPRSRIARVKISGSSNNQEHLILMVIDVSGSMSGTPIKNAQYSLLNVLEATYQKSNLITHIISYDNTAKDKKIDKSFPKSFYEKYIADIFTAGGTSFKSAFDMIKTVCESYKFNKNIGGVSIVFLTDGEDMSFSVNDRPKLIGILKESLDSSLVVQYTVHTVGFGASHDFNFLSKLKDIGTHQGAYRYANPSENNDILSAKINSIIDVITNQKMNSGFIIKHPGEFIGKNSDVYWYDYRKAPQTITENDFIMKIDDNEIMPDSILITEPTEEIINEWITFSVDKIIGEVISLNSSTDHNKNLHLKLINCRIDAIMSRINKSNQNITRLESLNIFIEKIKSGEKVDIQKLTDIKYEGIFKTNIISKNTSVPYTHIPQKRSYKKPTTSYNRYVRWEILETRVNESKCPTSSTDPYENKVIARYDPDQAYEYFNNQGSISISVIMRCALIGKYKMLEQIASLVPNEDRNDVDYEGNTALDIALIKGYWKSATVLHDNGYCASKSDSHLKSCLMKDHVKTAKFILDNDIASVTEDMISSAPNYQISSWIEKHNTKNISIETVINKGLNDKFYAMLPDVTNIDISKIYEIFICPGESHSDFLRVLISKNLINISSSFELEGVLTSALFLACENGHDEIVEIILENLDEDGLFKCINFQNTNGTTPLWISCCNGFSEIALKLLSYEANPNITNLKGDGPLIPAIQKGTETLIKLLIESGAKVNYPNINGDSPVLIACRTGNHIALEMCLESIDSLSRSDTLATCAIVDGFNPLIAAAEQNRVECIKLCLKYGADINFITSYTNQIIGGGTALHVASMYGMKDSVKILIEMGADLKKQTTSGFTALHIAVKNKHIDVVKLILAIDSDKSIQSIKDLAGMTSKDYSMIKGYEKIYEECFVSKSSILMEFILIHGQNQNQIQNQIQDRSSNLDDYQLIEKYGASMGFYDYELLEETIGGYSVGKISALSGNQHLLNLLARTSKLDSIGRFWAKYLKINISDDKDPLSDSEENSMIQRINLVIGKNLQNKMILDMRGSVENNLLLLSSPDILIKESKSDLLIQMDKAAIELLESENKSNNNTSLFSFLEKGKRGEFKAINGIDRLIFESKILAVELLAKGLTNLEPSEIMAIYIFSESSDIRNEVNKTMTNWIFNSKYHQFIKCFVSGLKKCKTISTESYSYVDISFSPEIFSREKIFRLNSYQIGYADNSKFMEVNKKTDGVLFIIKSDVIDISLYTKFPSEKKIIILPNQNYKINELYTPTPIVLAQSNIRKTAYRASEKDINTATASKGSIIIEIEAFA